MALRRQFRRDERGATAIEFAFIAPLLIVLLIATVEVGLMELMSSNLDAAVIVATRKIRTGATDRPTSSAAFADQVCATMIDSLATCRSRLAASVQKATDFTSAQTAAEAKPAGQFDAGGPGDVIVVNVTYTWPLILPMYAGNFRLSGPSQAVLDTRAAFRNEPFA